MFRSRFVFLLAAALLLPVSTPAKAFLALPKANKAGHLDHLHHAAHELKSAHAAVNGNNGIKGGQHVATAIGHIEKAIEHHKHHLNQTRTGVTGALATAAHHRHHDQLHEALHSAKAAEKQIAAGNAGKAAEDINKAHHHVELAMHSHHALLGK